MEISEGSLVAIVVAIAGATVSIFIAWYGHKKRLAEIDKQTLKELESHFFQARKEAFIKLIAFFTRDLFIISNVLKRFKEMHTTNQFNPKNIQGLLASLSHERVESYDSIEFGRMIVEFKYYMEPSDPRTHDFWDDSRNKIMKFGEDFQQFIVKIEQFQQNLIPTYIEDISSLEKRENQISEMLSDVISLFHIEFIESVFIQATPEKHIKELTKAKDEIFLKYSTK